MDPDSITRMSYWYPLLREYSIESYSYRCSEELLSDISRVFFTALESNPFVIAKKLLRKHRELREFLRKYIRKWGAVFVRGDLGSPKDACLDLSYWMPNPFKYGLVVLPRTQHNACISLKPETALGLVIHSERMMSMGDPSILWIRKPTILKDEVRVFVKNRVPRLISWYYPEEPLKYRDAPAVLYRMKDLAELVEKVYEETGLEDFTLDIGFSSGRMIVVELTPFPIRERPYFVDTIMFRKDFWEKLDEAIKKNMTIARYPTLNTEIVEFYARQKDGR